MENKKKGLEDRMKDFGFEIVKPQKKEPKKAK
jgi:hypothetical protein